MDNFFIWPLISTKKTVGMVEAFANGVWFTPWNGGQAVDINFSNIKHAFFQPCEDELIVIIHFNLHWPHILNNKWTENIQFYMEVGSLVDDLDTTKWKRNLTDEEEYELEKWEKEHKIKLNQKIKKFSEAIQDVAKSHKFHIEFDIPYMDLAFDGAPGRSLVKIMPTLNCLVNLTE